MNWTQIRHRRPEKHVRVLVWNNRDKDIDISIMNDNLKFEFSSYPYGEYDGEEEYEDGVITHWMHMPEAPKEF